MDDTVIDETTGNNGDKATWRGHPSAGGLAGGGGLPGLDLSEDEATEALERFRRDQVKRDGRICACGHPISKHMEIDVRGDLTVICRTSRLECPCKDPKPVLEAQDTRVFLHKTKGRGAEHALVLGMTASRAKGRAFGWLEGWPKCELGKWPEAECQQANGVRPYPVSLQTKRLTDRQEPYTLLLCLAHATAAIEKGLPL